MPPTLQALLRGLPVQHVDGPLRARVEAICTDSRRVVPHSVFFALPGRSTSGSFFVEQAIHRGAVAVVSQEKIWVPRKVTLIVVDDIRATLADMARRFYGNPERQLGLVGITGTSGKTVVASLVRAFLEQPDEPVGLLGTIHYALGQRTLPAYRTTPEPVDLFAMFSQMKSAGCRRMVMEVSSHGIDQGRVRNLSFRTCAFLNLSCEHLDYHGSMENYFATIQRVFSGENGPHPKTAVLNVEDSWHARLRDALPSGVRVVTFGVETDADFRASDLELNARDTRFTLNWPGGGPLRVVSPLIGRFNVSNVLAALATAYAEGASPADCVARLIDFEGVRGRMESIDVGQDFNIVIDYAHTEESYRQGLAMLRTITDGRIITVFGCGGNRDPRKRPGITRTVIEGSALAYATADNPRGEDLRDIFSHMKEGMKVGDAIIFIEDRRHAISLALSEARPGDTVLIAGKGHETFQEYADSVVPFDDRAVVRDILKNRLNPNF